jgi:hypothetical protein
MSDGINLTGFNETKPAAANSIDASGDYSPATGSFPAAEDKSTQDGAGLGQNGK